MQVANTNPDANDTALDLRVQAGEAPMAVNSPKMVANLNADRIDDREASSFANGVGGKATNADKLDGKDSTALGVTMKSSHEGMQSCVSGGVASYCAHITVKVPAGKQYELTVWSSLNANSLVTNTLDYCANVTGGDLLATSCLSDGQDTSFGGSQMRIALAANYPESAATSGQIIVPAWTYTFSTFVKAANGNVLDFPVDTTVMVRDTSAPGPSIN